MKMSPPTCQKIAAVETTRKMHINRRSCFARYSPMLPPGQSRSLSNTMVQDEIVGVKQSG